MLSMPSSPRATGSLPSPRRRAGIAMSSQIKDKTAGEEILRASGLDWTIVYPTKLTNGPKAEARVVPETRRSGRRRTSHARAWPRSWLQAATENLPQPPRRRHHRMTRPSKPRRRDHPGTLGPGQRPGRH